MVTEVLVRISGKLFFRHKEIHHKAQDKQFNLIGTARKFTHELLIFNRDERFLCYCRGVNLRQVHIDHLIYRF